MRGYTANECIELRKYNIVEVDLVHVRGRQYHVAREGDGSCDLVFNAITRMRPEEPYIEKL